MFRSVIRLPFATLPLLFVLAAHAQEDPATQKKPPVPGVSVGETTGQGSAPDASAQGDSRRLKLIDWDRLHIARSKTSHGDKLLKRDEYVRAEKAFRQAIEQEENYPVAYMGLGAALLGQRKFVEALDTLHEAEERYIAWRDRVERAALTMRKMNADAEQELRDLEANMELKSSTGTSDSPQRGQAARQIARAQMNRVQSIGQMSLRLYDHPEDLLHIPAQVFYLEGVCNLRLGRRDKGIELLKICLLLDDKHVLAHYNLAVALFTRGELQQAKAHLDAAIAGGMNPPTQFVHDLDAALPR